MYLTGRMRSFLSSDALAALPDVTWSSIHPLRIRHQADHS
jgi:hypothetical protein